MTTPDPYMFGSYREYAEAQFEDEQKNATLECATHGLFEIEAGPDCPDCGEELLPADLWRLI